MRTLLGLSFAAAAHAAVSPYLAGHQDVPQYTIDLDAAPETRYNHIIADTSNGFNTTVWKFWDQYFANDAVLRDLLYGIVDVRGAEVAEMQGEIEGMAAASGLPVKFVQGVQMLYELQTVMVPLANFSGKKADYIPPGMEALARLPWHGPGCTGIIAKCADGKVYHARNLDFAPRPIMSALVYNAIFKKGGKELFRSQMIAGYAQVITAARLTEDGYAVERNTRYTNHEGGNMDMLKNIFGGRQLNGWVLRKILESTATYDEAIAAISAAKYASTEYAIVSGSNKGTVISRDPDGVAFTQTLGQPNFEERSDYIIMTNFDYFFHDVREFFDPTGHGGLGKPTRRVAAQTILNATAVGELTPDVLVQAINAEYVLADTVFQALMSVQAGVWNTTQPLYKDP